MRVTYDWVTCSGVTDALPNMLTVRPNSVGSLVWRKLHTRRYVPYWLSGHFTDPSVAARLIRHYAKTLQRTGGTVIVQVRDGYDLAGGRRERERMMISIHHTTRSRVRAVSEFSPEGLPAKL